MKEKDSEKRKQYRQKIISKQSMFMASSLPKETKKILEDFDLIVDSVLPISYKQKASLYSKMFAMSQAMNSTRSNRRLGYMNDKSTESAYIRYFMWWNLIRLSRLFVNMPCNQLEIASNICCDIGSGPLTIPIALWLSRRELRHRNLVWYCVDSSQGIMNIGSEIFLAIQAQTAIITGESYCKWEIIRVNDTLGTSLKQKASLLTCANVFNEIAFNSKQSAISLARQYAPLLTSYMTSDGQLILVEPGTPDMAAFISCMRQVLLHDNFTVLSPCPHNESCCMKGKNFGNNKWCNFAFSTHDVPQKLLRLSCNAHLEKHRAVLSYIALSRKKSQLETDNIVVRITSDLIKLQEHKIGYYACSHKGLCLVVFSESEKHLLHNGDLVTLPKNAITPYHDAKSNATIIAL